MEFDFRAFTSRVSGHIASSLYLCLCRSVCSLSGTATVTFSSVHIRNVVAKKRDASTELLRRLYGYMQQHNVNFIGGDFNMSAFCTFGEMFADPEFSAPGNSFLWGLGALKEANRECTGFLIVPMRPYEWRVDSHGCYEFDNAVLGLGPRDQSAHLPVFLHLRTTNLPGPDSITRSEQAQQRRLERKATRHERRKHDEMPLTRESNPRAGRSDACRRADRRRPVSEIRRCVRERRILAVASDRTRMRSGC